MITKKMAYKKVLASCLCAGATVFAGTTALAASDDAIRIGVIATWSGPYADYGRQFDAGMGLYLQQHNNQLAGKPVVLIRKDTAGPAPDMAKRYAQELIVKDKVNFITGLDFSPNAYAIAPVVTQGKTPTIIMNAASSGIPASSPYMARVAFTVQQVSAPMARWMLKTGIKNAYTVVANYAPGIDAELAFQQTFIQGGGEITGQVRTPMNTLDFSAYVQRIKDDKPEAVFVFFPSGIMPPAFMKAWQERGLDQAGITLYATGEATDDSYLEATGDVALGLVTSHHYSYAHASEKNQQFVQAFEAAYGSDLRPSYFAVAAYDAMAVLDAALAKTAGDMQADKVMAALKGLRLESPRGPIEIDAQTRDIIQTVYIRRVAKLEGKRVNLEFDQFDRVADPALSKKP